MEDYLAYVRMTVEADSEAGAYDKVTAIIHEGFQALRPVRAENHVHGSDQQGCHPSCPTVMITDHVPAVRLPPDHASRGMAAAIPA